MQTETKVKHSFSLFYPDLAFLKYTFLQYDAKKYCCFNLQFFGNPCNGMNCVCVILALIYIYCFTYNMSFLLYVPYMCRDVLIICLLP